MPNAAHSAARNAPMLAVNESLGYRPYSRRVEWEWSRGDA